MNQLHNYNSSSANNPGCPASDDDEEFDDADDDEDPEDEGDDKNWKTGDDDGPGQKASRRLNRNWGNTETYNFKHAFLSRYFQFVQVKESGKVEMQCLVSSGNGDVCGKFISIPKRTNSNLYKHLQAKHGKVWGLRPVSTRTTRFHIVKVGTVEAANVNARTPQIENESPFTFNHAVLSQYFEFSRVKANGKLEMTCVTNEFCNSKLSIPRGNYSNLRKHLRAVHPDVILSDSIVINRDAAPATSGTNRNNSYSTYESQIESREDAEVFQIKQEELELEDEYYNSNYPVIELPSDPIRINSNSNDERINSRKRGSKEIFQIPNSSQKHFKKNSEDETKRRRLKWNYKFHHPFLSRFFTMSRMKSNGKLEMRCMVVTDQANHVECNTLLAVDVGNYCNLKKHLQGKHPELYATQTDSEDKQTHQTAELQGSNKPQRKSQLQEHFDSNMLDLCTEEKLPLNFIESKSFQMLIQGLETKVQLKSTDYYIQKLKTFVESNVLQEINDDISVQNANQTWHFSCTGFSNQKTKLTDGNTNSSCMIVKCHYVNEHWIYVSKYLGAVRNSRDGFDQLLANIGIVPKNIGVVIGGLSKKSPQGFSLDHFLNIDEVLVNAGNFGEEDDEDDNDAESFISFGSVLHKLQLALMKSIADDTEAASVLKFINLLLVSLKNLDTEAELDQLKNILPEADFQTLLNGNNQWSIILNMLELLQEEKFAKAVTNMIKEGRTEQLTLLRQQTLFNQPHTYLQAKARELFSILGPFGESITKLEASDSATTTANLAVLSVMAALKRVVGIITNHFHCLKSSLLVNTKSMLERTLNRDEFVIASILDPRQRLKIFSISWSHIKEIMLIPGKEEAKSIIKASFNSFIRSSSEEDSLNGSKSETLAQKKTQRESMFDILYTTPLTLSHNDSKPTELDTYLDEEVSDENVNPLNYWKSKSKLYPTLSKMAKHYLAIPTTKLKENHLDLIKWDDLNIETINDLIMYRQHRLTAG